MKRFRFFTILGSIGIVVILILSMQVASTEAAGEKVTWTLATNPGPAANSWTFYPYPRFQKLLEERSGGRFILKTKMALYPPKEVIHAVMAGRVEMGWERTPWLSGTFPLWDLALPFFWDNIFQYEAALNDPRMIAIDKKTFGEKGLIKIADIGAEALDGIFANRPLATVADFKGIKIRTAGVIPTLALKLMGASPLTMATTEILEAMQRRTVDAIQTSRGWGMGFGLPDVSTHVSIWRVQSVFPGMLIVNKKAFDALPADLQKILWMSEKKFRAKPPLQQKSRSMNRRLVSKSAPLNWSNRIRKKLIKPDIWSNRLSRSGSIGPAPWGLRCFPLLRNMPAAPK